MSTSDNNPILDKDEFLAEDMDTHLDFVFFHKGFLHASSKLSKSAIRLYLLYSLNANYVTGKIRDLTTKYIIDETSMGKSQIYEAKKELKALGLVSVSRGGMYLPLLAYTYTLSQQKQRTNEEKRIKKSVTLDGGSKVMEDLLNTWKQRRA